MTTDQASAATGTSSRAAADPRSIVQGPGYRFSVLTDRLIRMEWSDQDTFVDLPTQLVQCRDFSAPDFSVRDGDRWLEIWTEFLHLRYDKQPFSPGGLSVKMRRPVLDDHRSSWRYASGQDVPGGHGNLGGTARTLDDADGACELEFGLFSTHGYAAVDDSNSVLLTHDGWVQTRRYTQPDVYLFGYGNDYRAGLRDYFKLTGASPLVPRVALGNWWSRFHRYTADSYLELVDRFQDAGVPFSVAVLDMDWHPVEIDPSLGNGWTGYTWDPELFPDPAGFVAALHERDMAVSLNVHPADGVRRHEAAYRDVARDLGIDPDSGLEIAFDITSREFVESYFTRLHHPHEDLGVDFWWIDWQSGSTTRMPSLDPLWMLNHLHYRDAARQGRRPLILSRYAGLGSHRYPIGFSGDTVATWASLDFQPYFTATAANVGYFWWSHDIGGHGGGAKDNELAVRWYQFGVFSPICRLHSSNSPFNSKEPWRFEPRTAAILTRHLRLRHQLVPYLYTAMWNAHTDGIPLVRPLYHDHPDAPEAYEFDNQYLFGPDLLVAPITTPTDPDTHLGQAKGWLPPGTWYDFFTGDRYDGGRAAVFHRSLERVPVLARAGAVVPMNPDPMAELTTNPRTLELRIFPGAAGGCVLIEDDGSAGPGPDDRQLTRIDLAWDPRRDGGADAVLTIHPPTGPGVLTDRTWTLRLAGVAGVRQTTCRIGGTVAPATCQPRLDHGSVVVELGRLDLADGAEVTLDGVQLQREAIRDRIFHLLHEAEIAYELKDRALDIVEGQDGHARIASLHGLELPGNLFGALLEILTARSGEPS